MSDMISTTAVPTKLPPSRRLFGSPALPRCSRRQRIETKPVVFLRGDELVYAETYDALMASPGNGHAALQAYFDTHATDLSGFTLIAHLGTDGLWRSACAIGTPNALADDFIGRLAA